MKVLAIFTILPMLLNLTFAAPSPLSRSTYTANEASPVSMSKNVPLTPSVSVRSDRLSSKLRRYTRYFRRQDQDAAAAIETTPDSSVIQSDGEPSLPDSSEDDSSESEDEGSSNDESGDEGETRTISVETQTIEVDSGSFPTSGIVSDPTDGQGELKVAMMWETINEYDTEIGRITEKCLVPFDDPSQMFCETSLNGQVLGAMGDQTTPSTSVEEGQATSTKTATEIGTPPTTLEEPLYTTALDGISTESATVTTTSETAPSVTSAISSSEIATSLLINVTVGDAQPTSATPVSADDPNIGATIEGSLPTASSADSIATAAAASEDAATVEIPGQKLQVLPIGLGIFGGLVGIVILIVLYVTYQRRKFKKQFRDRKLVEDASPMGMGGKCGSA